MASCMLLPRWQTDKTGKCDGVSKRVAASHEMQGRKLVGTYPEAPIVVLRFKGGQTWSPCAASSAFLLGMALLDVGHSAAVGFRDFERRLGQEISEPKLRSPKSSAVLQLLRPSLW